jgi:glycerol-3-phosphate cytidylyltransferase
LTPIVSAIPEPDDAPGGTDLYLCLADRTNGSNKTHFPDTMKPRTATGALYETDSDNSMSDEISAYGVGYASGVFDMFHVGHLNILRRAREHCGTLVVGVASDEYVLDLKGREPVVPLAERLDIISALGIVDEVIIDHSEDKTRAWHERNFDVIFKGDDWKDTTKGARLERQMLSIGVAVVYFPYTLHTSSTLLRSYLTRTEAV